MVSCRVRTEYLGFNDEVDKENGTVVYIFGWVKQAAVEGCDHVVKPFVIMFVLDNENGVVEPCETKVHRSAIKQAR